MQCANCKKDLNQYTVHHHWNTGDVCCGNAACFEASRKKAVAMAIAVAQGGPSLLQTKSQCTGDIALLNKMYNAEYGGNHEA